MFCCFVGVVAVTQTEPSTNSCLPPKDLKLRPFQPDVKDDFPTIEGGMPKIPHIIHQTYKSESIPDLYWENIKSVVKQNPSWTYYFWSDASARKLIAERHPALLKTYDGYNQGIKRGDALRYVILYEFGGVYLDMDYEVIRPFDRATTKYSCIIAPEVFEHSAFLYKKEILIMNCIMFSRLKHPFFKHLMDKLPEAAKSNILLHATGPLFVTKEYLTYNNMTDKDNDKMKNDCSSNSPYFYKGQLPEDHENAVYVPHTQYFNDIIDFGNGYEKRFGVLCNKTQTLPLIQQRGCAEMERRGMFRKDTRFTFTRHKWSHIYQVNTSKFKYKNIKDLVPNAIIY